MVVVKFVTDDTPPAATLDPLAAGMAPILHRVHLSRACARTGAARMAQSPTPLGGVSRHGPGQVHRTPCRRRMPPPSVLEMPMPRSDALSEPPPHCLAA